MKTKYFTKVENRFVFNVSLIFWHFFIAVSILIILASIGVAFWSVLPARKEVVEKETAPEKRSYPSPVKVSVDELELEDTQISENNLEAPEPVIHTSATVKSNPPVEDIQGREEFVNLMDTLKQLIPPSKFKWEGAGYWTYPQGERYWIYYKQEQYRKYITTELGLLGKLENSFKTANCDNYISKSRLLRGYVNLLSIFPEDQRFSVIHALINNVANSPQQNTELYSTLPNLISKIKDKTDVNYINLLLDFGKRNPRDGKAFIEYTANILNEFDASQQRGAINILINSYYNFFGQNLSKQMEATNLFVKMLNQVAVDKQVKALKQYYIVYLDKNQARNQEIAQIDYDHLQATKTIEQNYLQRQSEVERKYIEKKLSKGEFRLKALMGIGVGIISIVLIATILVFLSIQRSVRSIEEKLVG